MKGQPHLLESADPLLACRDYEAMCGSQIKDAYFAGIWDAAYLGAVVLNVGNICPRCIEVMLFAMEARKLAAEPIRRRYLYGALNGSEVKRGTDND